MTAKDHFTGEEVQRILGLTAKQLDYWERLRLITPQREDGLRVYDFRDLIGLRTIKQLVEQGVPANRLRRSLAALQDKLARIHAPLAQLRIASDGKDIVVEQDGARLEPLSGQFVLNFETRELTETVRVMTGKPASEWISEALRHEASGAARRGEAIAAYDRALAADPRSVDALLNGGTLYYEDGNFAKAADYFSRALESDPQSALAHFNLGSVMDELGCAEDARRHLRVAIKLEPGYADAHYNLAFLSEKLGTLAEARAHWLEYLRLEPVGPWADYARQRLGLGAARSARRNP